MTRRRKVEEGRDEIWVGGYVYFRERERIRGVDWQHYPNNSMLKGGTRLYLLAPSLKRVQAGWFIY